MKGLAGRWWAALALSLCTAAVATPVAAAAERFVPRDPGFVIADLSRTMPDAELRGLLARWRAAPDSETATVALAQAFIDRARRFREPRYFGRAEAVLGAKVKVGLAGADLRRLYAETLQFRHAFAPAEAILDRLLHEQPRDGDSRLRRGSLRLTRGDFAGARADCAQLTLASSRGTAALAVAGVACLAESLAGSGDLERARVLLDAMTANPSALDSAVQAYLLSTRAELAERAGDLSAAIDAYRQAARFAPQDDAIRAALSDALEIRADARASAPLQVENPGLALLVRQAAIERDGALCDRAREWLLLEEARGDAIHHREAALLALAEGRVSEALSEARKNFESQRELPDVRILARAAMAAGDAAARRMLAQWLSSTGYQDAITTGILAGDPHR